MTCLASRSLALTNLFNIFYSSTSVRSEMKRSLGMVMIVLMMLLLWCRVDAKPHKNGNKFKHSFYTKKTKVLKSLLLIINLNSLPLFKTIKYLSEVLFSPA